ncbi:MAG: metal-dependent hydrolase [Proteobacteria bacterium]|nr:MAG: metal-dependent hydrolase [Pseudomonadota bacterium]QKK10292.1 MAG: metal-dependent hydrolase [Pseudomonadota bacterium]
MDPVSQGVLGAVFAQTRGPKQGLAKAAVIGAIAGMAADLDILIKSSADPLLAVEFHRHFTHSLLFIPIGGLLCSLLLYPILGKRWRLSYAQTLMWSIIGYATHGLLDGCTTYGTKLLWPLSDQRYSLDIISIVDPLFTVPLLVLVSCAAITRSRQYVKWAMLWGAVYLSIGYLQHERAEAIGFEVAQSRGHQVLRLEAKPSFGNLAVWKVVYETADRFYVDAVKPSFSEPTIWPGDSVLKLNAGRDFPWLSPESQQALDIERFSESSAGYIAVDPRNGQRIGDVRYSMLPQKIAPLWGVELSPTAGADDHVAFYAQRDNARAALKRVARMIFE